MPRGCSVELVNFIAFNGPLKGEAFSLDSRMEHISLQMPDGRVAIYENTHSHPDGNPDALHLRFIGVRPGTDP
jgi:hypothetical protein